MLVKSIGVRQINSAPTNNSHSVKNNNSESSLTFGDSYAPISAKTAKPSIFKRAAKLVTGAATIAAITLGASSCEKDYDNKPAQPIDRGVTTDSTKVIIPDSTVVVKPADSTEVFKLKTVQDKYMATLKAMGFVDVKAEGLLDSLVLEGNPGEKIIWKVDAKKSKGDTIFLKELTVVDNEVVLEGEKKFFSKDKGLQCISTRTIDSEKSTDVLDFVVNKKAVIVTEQGKAVEKYYPRNSISLILEDIASGGKYILTRLFLSMKK